MFSKKWSEANGATQAQAATATSLNPFALKANGTGPFMIVSHEPGVKTVFKPNPNWWGKAEHNLDRGDLPDHQVGRHARRGAAVRRHRHDGPGARCRTSSVSRTAPTPGAHRPGAAHHLPQHGFVRDELLYSNVKGKNPFKDARVRKAFYQAIDMEAIHTKIMRGMSANSALLISPLLFARAGEFKRWPYDVAAAQEAAGRGRLSQRLRGGDGLPERPLRQRRGDLPGGDADAGAHRHQGEAQRHAEGEVLREGRRRPGSTIPHSTCWAGRRARSTAGT